MTLKRKRVITQQQEPEKIYIIGPDVRVRIQVQ